MAQDDGPAWSRRRAGSAARIRRPTATPPTTRSVTVSTHRSGGPAHLAQREHLGAQVPDDEAAVQPAAEHGRRRGRPRPTRPCRATAGGVRRPSAQAAARSASQAARTSAAVDLGPGPRPTGGGSVTDDRVPASRCSPTSVTATDAEGDHHEHGDHQGRDGAAHGHAPVLPGVRPVRRAGHPQAPTWPTLCACRPAAPCCSAPPASTAVGVRRRWRRRLRGRAARATAAPGRASGLNGEAGTVPDVEPAHVEEGSFVSEHRGGLETGFTIVTPARRRRRRCRSSWRLHGRGSDHRSLVGPKFRIERFLEDHVERGGEPFAIGTVDGGQSYWHERPDGEDAGAMVVDEFLPMLAERGLLAAPTRPDRPARLVDGRVRRAAARRAARRRPGGRRRGGEPGHVGRPGRRVEVGLPRRRGVRGVHGPGPPGRPGRDPGPGRLRHRRPVLPSRRGLRRRLPGRRRRHQHLRAGRARPRLLAPDAARRAGVPRRASSLDRRERLRP